MGAVAAVAIVSLAVARLSAFQKDLRRSISLGVAIVAFLTLLLSINILVTALRLRSADGATETMAAQWNGLLLGAIMLLLVSALAFFFALGVFLWSLLPPTGKASPPDGRPQNRLGTFESPSKTINPLESR